MSIKEKEEKCSRGKGGPNLANRCTYRGCKHKEGLKEMLRGVGVWERRNSKGGLVGTVRVSL